MNAEEMQNAITQLVNGEISELLVEKEDFLTFRTLWLKHENKDEIKGQAQFSGKTIYRYTPKEIESELKEN